MIQLASKSVNWFDGFLGARYTKNFGENFYTTLRVDAGGGGSTFSWFANAVLGYRITELFSLSVNYRILSVDYEKGLAIITLNTILLIMVLV